MRKFLYGLILLMLLSKPGYAANKTIGDLVADTAPGSTDVVEIEQSDASASNKVTLANLSKGLTVTSMISGCTDAQVLGGTAGGTGVECQADAGGATIDDTKGNGDTTYTWSADKSFDQLALKKALVVNAVTEVACAGSIADAITAATAGDTLILGSCSYSLSAALTIDKSLSIIGQGSNRTILAFGANAVDEGIAVDSSDVLLSGFKMTGSAVTQAININDEQAADVTGVDVEDVWIVTSLASGGMGAVHYENASGQVENAILEITTGDMSGSNQQWGITAFYDADCGADHKVQVKNTYVKLISNDGTSVSGPQPIRPYMIWNNSSSICEYDHRLIVQDSAGIAYNATPADNDNNTNGINCQGANAARNYGTVGGTYCDVINSYIDGGSTHPSSSTGALDIRCDDYAECQLTDATLRRNSIQNINSGVITRLGVINASGLVISGGEQASPYIVGAASSLTGQQGGNDYLTGAAAGEAGAAISVTSGVGGSATAATTTGTGGASGAVALASNTGGAQDTATASANVGGASGAVTINTGDGGAATNGTVSNTGGAAGPVYIYGGVGGAGATAAGADGNVYLAVNAAGTRRGIVGIGTTSPLTGSTADIRTASGAILTISRNDTSISDTDSIGKIQWYGTDTNDADVYANIEVTAQGDTTSNAAGKMVFRTTATTAPVERMRISSAGLVGIGTSGPDKILEINIGTTDALRLTYNDNNGTATNYVDYAVDSSGNPKITPSAGALTGVVRAASGVITASALADADMPDNATVTGWTLGTSSATTPAENDNDTSIATTAYVQTEISALSGGGGDVEAVGDCTTGACFTGTSGITLTFDSNSAAAVDPTIASSAADLILTAGDGITSGSGGAVQLITGNGAGTSKNGGSLIVSLGDGGEVSGNGGSFTLETGNGGGTGASGSYTVTLGTPTEGNAGDFSFVGQDGVGTNKNGSSFSISLGAKTGSGTDGLVNVYNGADVLSVLNFDTVATSTKTFTFPNETGTLCTTGSVCTGYQATVAEGTLADSTVVSADIKDGEIAGGDLASTIAITSTGAQDFGGGSVEIGNGTSRPATCAVGQIFMDTDATSGQRIYACESADTWALQGDGGGAGGGATDLNLPIYSAKLTGAYVVFTPTSADACTAGAQIDAGDGNWRLLFDATTDECATWQFVMPDNYASTPHLKVKYSMVSGTSNAVTFEGSIMCVTPGDAADIGTASFSSIATATDTVPGTVGYPDAIDITLTDDSCAAGDIVFVVLSTDANGGAGVDDATGDREILGVELDYA